MHHQVFAMHLAWELLRKSGTASIADWLTYDLLLHVCHMTISNVIMFRKEVILISVKNLVKHLKGKCYNQ